MARHIVVTKFVQVTAVIVLASLQSNYNAMAQDQPVRIAIASRTTGQSLGWIGTELGIFKQLGLSVSFPAMGTGGPKAMEGLIRGDWDFAITGAATIIQGTLDGQDTVILLSPSRPGAGGLFLVARGGITEPGQLAGGRIAVPTEGGSEAVMVRGMLRKWGITATLVPGLGRDKIPAALSSREMDAGVLPAEYRLAAQRAFRLNTLADLGSEFGFQPAALATTRRLIKSNRAVVARVVEGYVRSIHLFKTDRSAVVPVLRRYLQSFDQETTEDIHAYFAESFQKLPLPSPQGIQNALNEYTEKYLGARSMAVTTFTDTSFLEEVERSGLLNRLYNGAKKEYLSGVMKRPGLPF